MKVSIVISKPSASEGFTANIALVGKVSPKKFWGKASCT